MSSTASQNAPVAIFCYKRLEHLKKAIRALQDNPESQSTELFIFADGAKSLNEYHAVNAVRAFIKTIKGFKKITIHESDYNMGLSQSIIQGITYVLDSFDRIIVLEDDMIVSDSFLCFMNSALQYYVGETKVGCIHGYSYPIKGDLPEFYFLKGGDCWGWATWRDRWELFNEDGNKLYTELKNRDLFSDFDFNGAYPFSRMLRDQIFGANDSWAIRWHASLYLENRLTLYPKHSFVSNIGLDSSGENCATTAAFEVGKLNFSREYNFAPVRECARACEKVEEFLYSTQRSKITGRVNGKIRKLHYEITHRIKTFLPRSMKRRVRRLLGISYESKILGPYSTWAEPASMSDGYETDAIIERVIAATKSLLNGTAASERDGVVFENYRYNEDFIILLYRCAIENSGSLHVLDIGGGIASHYLNSLPFIDILDDIDWKIFEQNKLVDAGRELIKSSQVEFIENIDTSLPLDFKPSIAILGSSLQYFEYPFDILKEIIKASPKYIYIERIPCVDEESSKIHLQVVSSKMYQASYPIWLFVEKDIINFVHGIYKVRSSVVSDSDYFYAKKKIIFKTIVLERYGDKNDG